MICYKFEDNSGIKSIKGIKSHVKQKNVRTIYSTNKQPSVTIVYTKPKIKQGCVVNVSIISEDIRPFNKIYKIYTQF